MPNRVSQKRSIGVVGIVAASCIVALQGCNKSESTPPPTANPESATATTTPKVMEVKTPEAPVAPALDVSAVLKDIANSKSLLDWYQIRVAYEAHESQNAEIDAALDAREQELAPASNPKAMSDSLDLIDLSWQLAGDDTSEEGRLGKFRVTWLFRVKAPITVEPDQAIRLVLRGWIDKAHREHFEGDKQFVEFTYDLVPPLTSSKAGSYYLVERTTYTEIPNVPYRLHTFFSISTKSDDGKWTYVGPYGKPVDSGWFADAGEIPQPKPADATPATATETVEATDDSGDVTPSEEASESAAEKPKA